MDDALRLARTVIADVAVALEVAPGEAREQPLDDGAAPRLVVVERHDRLARWSAAQHPDPLRGPRRHPRLVKHLQARLVALEVVGGKLHRLQACEQRLEHAVETDQPVRRRRARDVPAVAGQHALEAVERHPVRVLGNDQPGQEVHRTDRLAERMRRTGRGDERALAVLVEPNALLLPVLDDPCARRLYVELLLHLHEEGVESALPLGLAQQDLAANPRQLRRQALAPGPLSTRLVRLVDGVRLVPGIALAVIKVGARRRARAARRGRSSTARAGPGRAGRSTGWSGEGREGGSRRCRRTGCEGARR